MVLFRNKVQPPEEVEQREDSKNTDEDQEQQRKSVIENSVEENNDDSQNQSLEAYLKNEETLDNYLKSVDDRKIVFFMRIVILSIIVIVFSFSLGTHINSGNVLHIFRQNYHKVDHCYSLTASSQRVLNKVIYLMLLNKKSVYTDIIVEEEVREELRKSFFYFSLFI